MAKTKRKKPAKKRNVNHRKARLQSPASQVSSQNAKPYETARAPEKSSLRRAFSSLEQRRADPILPRPAIFNRNYLDEADQSRSRERREVRGFLRDHFDVTSSIFRRRDAPTGFTDVRKDRKRLDPPPSYLRSWSFMHCTHCFEPGIDPGSCRKKHHLSITDPTRIPEDIAVRFIWANLSPNGVDLRLDGSIQRRGSLKLRFRLCAFLLTLQCARVFHDPKFALLCLQKHLCNVQYPCTVREQSINKGDEIWPSWFKLEMRRGHGMRGIEVGLIDNLNGIDGFGIATVSMDHYGDPTMLAIWCYPHYEAYQWWFNSDKAHGSSHERTRHVSPVCDMAPEFGNRISPSQCFEDTDDLSWQYEPFKSVFPSPFHYHSDLLYRPRKAHDSVHVLPYEKHNVATNDVTKHQSDFIIKDKAVQKRRLFRAHDPRSTSRRSKYLLGCEPELLAADTQVLTEPISIQEEPAGIQPVGRMKLAVWKEWSGKSKTWKATKVLKDTHRQVESKGIISLPKHEHVPTVAHIPHHLIKYQGFRNDRPIYYAKKGSTRSRRDKSVNLKARVGDDLLFGEGYQIDSNFDDLDGRPPRADRPRRPPQNFKELIATSSRKIETTAGATKSLSSRTYRSSPTFDEVFHELVIPPFYLIIETIRVERHFKVFRATHLNDGHRRYDIACIELDIDTATMEGPEATTKKKIFRYRLEYVRKLQAKSTYLDTVAHHGRLWIIQRSEKRPLTLDPATAVTMKSNYRPTAPPPITALPKFNKLSLKRGSKEFAESFPPLNKTLIDSHTQICPSTSSPPTTGKESDMEPEPMTGLESESTGHFAPHVRSGSPHPSTDATTTSLLACIANEEEESAPQDERGKAEKKREAQRQYRARRRAAKKANIRTQVTNGPGKDEPTAGEDENAAEPLESKAKSPPRSEAVPKYAAVAETESESKSESESELEPESGQAPSPDSDSESETTSTFPGRPDLESRHIALRGAITLLTSTATRSLASDNVDEGLASLADVTAWTMETAAAIGLGPEQLLIGMTCEAATAIGNNKIYETLVANYKTLVANYETLVANHDSTLTRLRAILTGQESAIDAMI